MQLNVRESILRQLKSKFQSAGVFDGRQLQIHLVHRTESSEVLHQSK